MDACVPDSVVVFLGVDRALEQLVKLFIDVAKDDLEHFAPSTAQRILILASSISYSFRFRRSRNSAA